MALTWGFGYMLVQVTYKPFLTEYIPSDIIGQVSGAINICYGLGRSLAILIAGAAVDYLFDNNYRYIFPMGMVMAIVSIWVSLSIPDLRYQARKRGEMD
jgi:MFS family permease